MKDQSGRLHRLAEWIDKKLRPEDGDDPVWPDAPPADPEDAPVLTGGPDVEPEGGDPTDVPKH
jgi:hypothetical protein